MNMFKVLSLIGLFVIGLLIYFANPIKILEIVIRADIRLLLTASVFVLIAIAMNVLRFHILVNTISNVSIKDTISVVSISQVLNQGTIAIVGDASKIAILKNKHTTSISKSFWIVLFERFQDFIILAILTIPILSKIDSKIQIIMILLITVAIVFMFSPALLKYVLKFTTKVKLLTPVNKFITEITEIRNMPIKLFIITTLISIISFIAGGIGMQFLLASIGQKIGLMDILAVNSIGTIIGFISGIPGGLGAREATFIAIYATYGLNSSAVLTSSILMRILFIGISFIGFILVEKIKFPIVRGSSGQ